MEDDEEKDHPVGQQGQEKERDGGEAPDRRGSRAIAMGRPEGVIQVKNEQRDKVDQVGRRKSPGNSMGCRIEPEGDGLRPRLPECLYPATGRCRTASEGFPTPEWECSRQPDWRDPDTLIVQYRLTGASEVGYPGAHRFLKGRL